MDYAEIESALKLVALVTDRAKTIVEGPPYWTYVSEPAWARLTLSGNTATLHLCEASIDWDSPVLDVDTVEFPVTLLLVDDAGLKAWKIEQKRLYDEERRKIDEERREATERQERAAYEALRQKYGTA